MGAGLVCDEGLLFETAEPAAPAAAGVRKRLRGQAQSSAEGNVGAPAALEDETMLSASTDDGFSVNSSDVGRWLTDEDVQDGPEERAWFEGV